MAVRGDPQISEKKHLSDTSRRNPPSLRALLWDPWDPHPPLVTKDPSAGVAAKALLAAAWTAALAHHQERSKGAAYRGYMGILQLGLRPETTPSSHS